MSVIQLRADLHFERCRAEFTNDFTRLPLLRSAVIADPDPFTFSECSCDSFRWAFRIQPFVEVRTQQIEFRANRATKQNFTRRKTSRRMRSPAI